MLCKTSADKCTSENKNRCSINEINPRGKLSNLYGSRKPLVIVLRRSTIKQFPNNSSLLVLKQTYSVSENKHILFPTKCFFEKQTCLVTCTKN